MHLLASFCIVVLLALPAAAAPSKVTLCLDGALVELEATAVKGKIEIPLPRGVETGSLRLKPLQGAAIASVEVTSPPPDRKTEKEAARLTARREVLSDRLKVLEVKEEIFRASAKSQSAKTPRPTKNNREPLENVRKGTEFALARLEEVFGARRKAENELRMLDARLAALHDPAHSGGAVARVRLEKDAGRVSVTYRHPGLKWTPSYDFRLNGNREVDVTLYAVLPPVEKGSSVAVLNAYLSDAATGPPIPVVSDRPPKIAVFRFPLEQENYSNPPLSALSFRFTNRTDIRMPPGESTCYRHGEYVGKTRFDGCLPGESKVLETGK